jgi:hypothetical protein
MKTIVRKRKRRPRAPRPFPWADRHWLLHNSDDPNRLWYEAMDALEQHGNNEPLIEMLLEPKCEVTPAVRECLADLLKRHTLVRRKGEPQIPIYAISQDDAYSLAMKDEVSELRKNGASYKDALECVANKWGVDENKLSDVVNGRRGSLQRTLERLERLTSKERVRGYARDLRLWLTD